jgi:hypothetical protein
MLESPGFARRLQWCMYTDPDSDTVLAYQTQVRYGRGEAWVTLDVSICRETAVDEAFFRSDPWGRAPTEIRVRSIAERHADHI